MPIALTIASLLAAAVIGTIILETIGSLQPRQLRRVRPNVRRGRLPPAFKCRVERASSQRGPALVEAELRIAPKRLMAKRLELAGLRVVGRWTAGCPHTDADATPATGMVAYPSKAC